jgi:hypothetical protein
MPTFFAISPIAIDSPKLDFNVDTRSQIQLSKGIDRLLGRFENIEQPFMGSNLELLTRAFINMGRAIHGKSLDPGRKRNRAGNTSASAPHRVDDVLDRLVEEPVIIGLKPDPNFLVHHGV